MPPSSQQFSDSAPIAIARVFASTGEVASVAPLGRGNIHDTYLATLLDPSSRPFVLQRMNTRVFADPEQVMLNIGTVTGHAVERLSLFTPESRRWESPRVLKTRDGDSLVHAADGSYWRALSFIGQAVSVDAIQNIEQAREVGWALGFFHRLVSDLPPEGLADTLPGFHIMPGYLRHFDELLRTGGSPSSSDVESCLQFILDRRDWSSVLEDAKQAGQIPLRIIHGDPKLNNILFDTRTAHAVSLIDLDTVKPGLVHYDIGDCLRSACNRAGEAPENMDDVLFDTDLAREILKGYFEEAGAFLTSEEIDLFYDAIRLLPFELGLRFLTDHMEGNVYFKVKEKDHNLRRALVQFRLVESIEAQEATIRATIEALR